VPGYFPKGLGKREVYLAQTCRKQSFFLCFNKLNEEFYFYNADLNSNGEVDAADLVLLINRVK
jgi:hypothetical protein